MANSFTGLIKLEETLKIKAMTTVEKKSGKVGKFVGTEHVETVRGITGNSVGYRIPGGLESLIR